jgi:hypothetical protein
MRVDLEDLERKARVCEDANPGDWYEQRFLAFNDSDDSAFVAAMRPEVALALIARIRELEAKLASAADIIDDGIGHDPRDHRSVEATAIRALLAKGAVLP